MYIDKKINILNFIISFLPLSIIIGNLAINVNVIIICILGFIIYGNKIASTNTNGNILIEPDGSGSVVVPKLRGQILSRPWLCLGAAQTTTQGPVIWSSFLINPDFSSPPYFSTSSQFITFSSTGFYRISASFTYMCTNANAPERQVFIEFRTSGSILISASDQVIAAEASSVFGNASFNKIIEITSTDGSTYFFNWGSFSTGGISVILTPDSHCTIERVA